MVKLENVTFGYDDEQEILIQNLSVAFAKGKISVILGRNGSGKTTLLKCIYGAVRPFQGTIFLDGCDISRLGCKQIARQIAVVRQEAHYIFPYTVMEVVLMGRSPHLNFLHTPSHSDIDKAMESLEMVEMGSFAERKIQELSSGEAQMILLARALCQSPELLLLDEPNAHLDIYNQYHLLELILKLKKEKGITVIAVIHLPEIAYWFADDVFMMEKGKMLFSGKTKDVMTAENLSYIYGIPMQTHALGTNYLAITPASIAGIPISI